MLKLTEVLFLIFAFKSVVGVTPLSNPLLTIDQGSLKGVTLETRNGYLYDVYYAIPFAEPPVGKLRFKAPEPAQGWEGTRDASSPGPICFQIFNITTVHYDGVEDCLYLNVYMPAGAYKKNNLPVMFWIHGGGLSEGSANEYEGKFLVEKDVVVVTTNYRLGVTGFLALSNSDVPGNAGLKDVVLALEWVQENIHHFGGDKDKVTIFGESAGGAISHFLIVSPTVSGLFDQAIVQSGASISEWPIQDYPEDIASRLFDIVGINSNNTNDLLDILWNMPIEQLLLVASQVPLTDGRITPFRPIIEGDYSLNAFIKDHPRHLLESGDFKHIPTMSGYTSQEGIFFIHLIDIHGVEKLEDVVPDFSFYIPGVIRNVLSSAEKEAVMDKIKDFYFPENVDLIEGFIDINSDHQFIKDMDKTARIFSKYEPKTYYYQFLYHGAFNYMKYLTEYNYTEASHADELGYINHDLTDMPSITDQDWLTLDRMVEMWTNFAKYGNPTPKITENIDVIWKPITDDEVNCLFIDKDLTLWTNPLQERLQFWRDLEAAYEHRIKGNSGK